MFVVGQVGMSSRLPCGLSFIMVNPLRRVFLRSLDSSDPQSWKFNNSGNFCHLNKADQIEREVPIESESIDSKS